MSSSTRSILQQRQSSTVKKSGASLNLSADHAKHLLDHGRALITDDATNTTASPVTATASATSSTVYNPPNQACEAALCFQVCQLHDGFPPVGDQIAAAITPLYGVTHVNRVIADGYAADLPNCREGQKQQYCQLQLGRALAASRLADASIAAAALRALQQATGDNRHEDSYDQLKTKDAKSSSIGNENDMVTTLDIASSLLLAMTLCLDRLNNAVEAVRLGERCLDIISQDRGDPRVAELLFRCKHLYGVAQGRCALSASALVDVREEQLRRAVVLLQEARDAKPSDHRILYHLALQQAILRDTDAALATATACLNVNGTYAPAWDLLTLLQHARGNVTSAIKTSELSAKVCPGHFTGPFILGKIYQREGQAQKALLSLALALSLWKQHSKYTSTIKLVSTPGSPVEMVRSAQPSINSITVKNTHSNNGSSSTSQSNNYNYNVEEIAERSLVIQILLSCAECYSDLLASSEDANRMINSAHSVDPSSCEPVYALAQLYRKQRWNDAALSLYELALSMNPSHKVSLLSRGCLYLEGGHVMLARQSFESALRTDGRDDECWRMLGVAQTMQGLTDAAAISFSNAVYFKQSRAVVSYESLYHAVRQ